MHSHLYNGACDHSLCTHSDFEKCVPEDVIYQLDYNKEGIKHQMEYVRMFEDCGWEYLTEFDGYNCHAPDKFVIKHVILLLCL